MFRKKRGVGMVWGYIICGSLLMSTEKFSIIQGVRRQEAGLFSP